MRLGNLAGDARGAEKPAFAAFAKFLWVVAGKGDFRRQARR